MNSYDQSQYVKAKRFYRCQATGCRMRAPGRNILAGMVYLQWRSTGRRKIVVCEECSVKLEPNGHPVWWCEAVVLKLRDKAATSAYKEQSIG